MKQQLCKFVFIVCLVLLGTFPAQALSRPDGTKVYSTRRFDSPPPVIDGQLTEKVWETGEWGTDFIQKQPYEGKAPSQKTAFKILYDRQHLYVGIRAFDSEPGKICYRKSRRDQCEGDWVQVILDSYHDFRTGFSFSVNASGVKKDVLISNDGNGFDENWEPIWYVKTAADDRGWTAEMKIPLSQLRFDRKEEHSWGLYVARFLHRKEEISEWKLIPRKASGLVSLFGELHGLKPVKSKTNIQLLPYIVGAYHQDEKEIDASFAGEHSNRFDIGLDGKIGVTDNLTLDLTVNPDFGQVEADPSEINLTAFETFFPEKRPFFIEGSNILDFTITGGNLGPGKDNLFYSRRIGRTPHYKPGSGNENVRGPDNTTILAAFKLTGKTRNGVSIGILESVTARETASITRMGRQPQETQETVEPLTNYFMLRLQKDVNEGKTYFGGMFTAVNRDLKGPQLDFLHRGAYTGGLDFSHSWKNKVWRFYFNTIFSHVHGEKQAILETQLSPRRYFQRPDASHVTLDPGRTSLSGHGGNVGLDKGGGRWRLSTGLTWRSPGLELNDIGYLNKADVIMQWFWTGYRITEPFGIFHQIEISLDQWGGWNFAGETIFGGANIIFDAQFKNYWKLTTNVIRHIDWLSTSDLRGGPALKQPGGWEQSIMLQSDERKKLRFQLEAGNLRGNRDSSRQIRFAGGVTYRPNSALSLSLTPAFENLEKNLQYVETVSTDSRERYVFGHIHQKILSVTLRLNYSITPDLSIQFYGEPFIATGKYTGFKNITNPRAHAYNDRFHPYYDDEITYNPDNKYYSIAEGGEEGEGGENYGFANPDFNFLQFRSNLVVRWEFTPGSTLYLVWSQGRTGFPEQFSFGRGMRDLFDLQPHNVFLMKFTYRFKL